MNIIRGVDGCVEFGMGDIGEEASELAWGYNLLQNIYGGVRHSMEATGICELSDEKAHRSLAPCFFFPLRFYVGIEDPVLQKRFYFNHRSKR